MSLIDILDKIFPSSKEVAKGNDTNTQAIQQDEMLDFSATTTKSTPADAYNLSNEDNENLELINNTEIKPDEIDYEQYVIESYEKELEKTKEQFQIQDDKDGVINEIYNGVKEIFNFGISKSDVASAIEKQEGIVEELKQARKNGNFAEVYEKITGNKFDEEKLFECHQMEEKLEEISTSENPEEFKEEFEEIANKYKELSNNYLGSANELTNVLNSYADSQNNFIDKTAQVAQIGGMVAMVAGGVACFIPGGQIIGAGMIKAGQMLALGGTFGDNVADFIDTLTNKQGFEEDKEQYKEILKETAIDGALFLAGYASGSVASKAGEAVLKNTGSKILSQITDKGLDIGLSLASDSAITGETISLDSLTSEGTSQFISILTGSATARMYGAEIKTKLDGFINDKLKLGVGKSDVEIQKIGLDDVEVAENEFKMPLQKTETSKPLDFHEFLNESFYSKEMLAKHTVMLDKLAKEIDGSYNIKRIENQNNEKFAFIAEKQYTSQDNPDVTVSKQVLINEDGTIAKTTTESSKGYGETWYYGSDKTTFMQYKINKDAIDVKSQIEILSDLSGEPSVITHTKPSDILEGAYETTSYTLKDYPEDFDILGAIQDGTIEQKIQDMNLAKGKKISNVTKSPDGKITYSEMRSRNGYDIQRNYIEQVDENGFVVSNKYTYEIQGQNGEKLLELDRSWSKNPDGTTTTVVNGQEYRASFDDDNFEITIIKPDGTKEILDFKDKTGKNEYIFGFMKNVPADDLLIIQSNIKTLNYSDGSAYSNTNDRLTIESHNKAILSHELGHCLDISRCKTSKFGDISTNEELIKIYNKEMELFKKDHPELVQNVIQYFSQQGGGKLNTGLCEFIAETNMLLRGYGNPSDENTARSQYLVRYFPETVAKIGGLLDDEFKIKTNSTIQAGIKTGEIKHLPNGSIDKDSMKSFFETYDATHYEKLEYIFKNYPNLNETAFKKLVGSFKTVEDMKLYADNIDIWIKQDSEFHDFACEIMKEGKKDVETTKTHMAQILGVPARVINARVKGVESIYDKITRKVLKGDKISDISDAKAKITDLIGTRIVLKEVSQDKIDMLVENLCGSIRAGEAIVTEVHNYSKNSQKYLSEENIIDIRRACAEAGIEVKILDNEQTSASGYVSAQMNIQYRDKDTGKLGELGELQIRGKIMDKYAEIEHIPYDIRRGKNIGKNCQELEEHFEPVIVAVNKLKRNGLDEIYDNYILQCYQYINKYERAEIEGVFELPKFPEELKEYEILSFDNLEKIDKKAKEIKEKNRIS